MNAEKFLGFLARPSKWNAAAARRIRYFYQLHVVRQPFFVAHRQWVRDRGDETLRLAYDLTPDSLVVDVGGYLGAFADAIDRRYRCSIDVFEPVHDFYQVCRQRFSENHRVRCFDFGLSDKDAEMAIARDDDASSTERPTTGRRLESIRLKDIATFMWQLDGREVDLLKINIEGGEYQVLPRLLETGLIKNIRHLQIQFHDFIPDAVPMRESIRQQMSCTHQERWNYPFVWESWERRPN